MLQNFLTTLFSTLGGAVGTVIILLTFGKQVVLKGLEVKLKQGADKNIQILSNKLDRKTRAFQLLLDNEMKFYESIGSYLADLIVDIQDFIFYLGLDETNPLSKFEYESVRDVFGRIAETNKQIKRSLLISQNYIPQIVFDVTTNLISDIQKGFTPMYNIIEQHVSDKEDVITKEEIKTLKDTILMDCALVNLKIKLRLEDLSKEN